MNQEPIQPAAKVNALPHSRPGGAVLPTVDDSLYRALIENSTDMITVFNADGTVRYTSPCVTRIMGYTPEEVIQTKGLAYVHPDDVPRVLAWLQALAGNTAATDQA